MDREQARRRLKQLYLERAVFFGDFTLASGRTSSYYLNSKKILFHSEAISLLGELLYQFTEDIRIDAIGGLEIGAIPMTAAVVARYHTAGRSLEGFFVRKQVKEHGSKERVEGMLPANARVAIIDDVLTTGESVLQAILEVEKLGATVVRVVCIVDRQEGAREKLRSYDLRPILTAEELLEGRTGLTS